MLQVIADFTGLNIITSDTVTGSLTLRLKDIPWDQALDIIMQTKGLDMRKNGNVVLIAPREELAVKEKQQLEAQAADRRPGAAADRVVPAQLHKAQDSSDVLNIASPVSAEGGADGDDGRQGSFLARAARAFVDPRTNILFVPDTREQARGGPPDHPADRHPGAAGDDRGADRHRQRQVQPAARRALRRPDRLHAGQHVTPAGSAGRCRRSRW